jgi:hypothetical protein
MSVCYSTELQQLGAVQFSSVLVSLLVVTLSFCAGIWVQQLDVARVGAFRQGGRSRQCQIVLH